MQPVKTLKEAKYSFDHVQNAWYCGKKPADEEEVLIHLILFAKSQNCKKQARIAGRVMRSVFIGWELRDEDADAIDVEVRNRIPKPQTPQREANTEALRRYREFMTKVVHLRPVKASYALFWLWSDFPSQTVIYYFS